jgi:glycosyltransferase involved in cell wall biosynthesis
VIDDNSMDGSLKELLKYQDVKNLNLHSNTSNLGVAASRNIGVSLCSCENIIIFDDDDVSSPERTLEHLRHLNSNSTLSYVSSEKIYSANYSKSFINKSYFGNLDSRKLLRYLNGLGGVGINNLYFPASTLAFKKNLWLQLNGFDKNFCRLEDIDFAFRASEIGAVFSFSDKILVTRFHSKGSDKSSDLDQIFLTKFLKKHMSLLDLDDYDQIKSWLKLRDAYFQGKIINLLIIVIKYFFSYPKDVSRVLVGVKRIFLDFMIKVKKI